MSDEINPTPNTGLSRLKVGIDYARVGHKNENWGDIYNSTLETIDEHLVISDLKENKDGYEPYNNSLFHSTDTGELFVGNGTSWTEAEIEIRIKNLEEAVEEHTHDGSYGESDELTPRMAKIKDKLQVPEYESEEDAPDDAGLIVDHQSNRLVYKRI